MKIGIDVDGVILDYQRMLNTYGELYDFIELKKDGVVDKTKQYLRDKYNWTEAERQNFIDKYFIELSEQSNLMPGAKDVINMLKQDHELIIISARGGMIKEMEDVALAKLEAEGLSFDKYYWNKEDKLETAKEANIDIMIDDTYEVCKKLSENGIRTIYFREKDMKKLEENEYVKEVSNWGEIYRYIKNLDSIN